jgi:DNA helicase HerA-like ATPase
MRAYISEIINLIQEKIKQNKSDSHLFKLEHFTHPLIYLEVAEYFRKVADANNLKFNAKLSSTKFEEYEKVEEYGWICEKFKEKGYVDHYSEMTKWRNSIAEEKGIIFLLATEMVIDRGGLADFYMISPEHVEEVIGENYYKWFKSFDENWSESDLDMINSFFTELFKVVPKNLLKLSNFVDQLATESTKDIGSILEKLGATLYRDWGVPCIHFSDLAHIERLNGKKIAELLKKAIAFKNREGFRDGLSKSKFNKLNQQFEEFELKRNEEIFRDYFEKIKDYFGSFEQFKRNIFDYFKGKDLENLREQLFLFDFNIINTVLNLKTPKNERKKKDTIKVYGHPIFAFGNLIYQCIKKHLEIMDSSGYVEFELTVTLQRATLANTADDENSLYDNWSKICTFTGGVLGFLQSELGELVKIRYRDDIDPFVLKNYPTDLIKPAPSSKKLSTIEFLINVNNKKNINVKWIIHPSEHWVESFYYLKRIREHMLNHFKFLPILFTKNIDNLLACRDEESFMHQLINSDIGIANIFDVLPKEVEEGIFSSKLFQLQAPFIKFIDDILENGFYNTINVHIQMNSTAVNFIDKYVEIIESIYKDFGIFTEIERKYLYLLANLFFIVKSEKVALDSKVLEGAIIPPFHPATLEKIIDQQSFYRKGLVEILKQLIEEKKQIGNVDNYLRNMQIQASINSGVDTILSDNKESICCKKVYGYYSLYGSVVSDDSIENNVLLDKDIVFDEEFDVKEMMNRTNLSNLITNQICQYIRIFPSKSDSISIAFVNFSNLQSIVAGVHEFIEKFKDISWKINVKLQIVVSKGPVEGRNYLNFWLDNFFTEDDNVAIETFYKEIDLDNVNQLKETLSKHDIVFIQNVLKLEEIEYKPILSWGINPSESRFPMVFHPMPFFESDKTRNVTISQPQFQASFKHSQLVYWIKHPNSVNCLYRVEKKLGFSETFFQIMDWLHEVSNWVVTLDSALDKRLLPEENVISFSSGVGDFGEINMTISTAPHLKEDLAIRLRNKLHSIFPSWSTKHLEEAARHCIEKAKYLDGIKIFKAFNPKDYEVHSFLSYIFTFKVLNMDSSINNKIVRYLIPLDSYSHWFGNRQNRPDYLLLEIDKGNIGSESVCIDATIIECKMGKEGQGHKEKGIQQLREGISYLSRIFNAKSNAHDRRYWYAQLYRTLIYAPLQQELSAQELLVLSEHLLKILEGRFLINWRGKLLTYWVDCNYEKIGIDKFQLDDMDVECVHESYGQLFIQRCLLPNQYKNEVSFEHLNNELNLFTDDEDEFEAIAEDIVDNDEENDSFERIPTRQTILPIEGSFRNLERANNEVIVSQEVANDKKSEFELKDDPEKIEKTINEDSSMTSSSKVENIRILIGTDTRTNTNVYWEYGHPQLENRHILISGRSGVGKTYFIQCMLYELTKQGVTSIIFDYTDGFTETKLESEFREGLKDKINELYVYFDKFPINPFKRKSKQIGTRIGLESITDVAERIKYVFSSVYGLGPQQANAIYMATMNGIEKYGDAMNLKYLQNELEKDGSNYAQTTLSRIRPLIDRNPFDSDKEYDWEKHFDLDAQVLIIQLSGFTREVQLIVTELILWDLWNHKLSHGDKSKPFAVIIDEAQNLDHGENSPSNKILTEGRKFGWSGWYATQFLQGQMQKDEIQRLQNAAQKVYFAPPEEEITTIASYLDTDNQRRKEWARKLANLKKGQCIVWGPSLRSDGNLEKIGPRIVNVTQFSERIGKR